MQETLDYDVEATFDHNSHGGTKALAPFSCECIDGEWSLLSCSDLGRKNIYVLFPPLRLFFTPKVPLYASSTSPY